MRRFGLFGLWLVVVASATTVTWQIVSAADNQVSDRPIAPLNVAAPVLTDSTVATTTTTSVTSTTARPTSSTPAPSDSSGSTVTTTSTSDPLTTQSNASPSWQSRSIQTAGGTVIVRYRPGEVEYQSATPAPGFQVEVEEVGPPEVKVEFESESQKFEVEAHWEDDGLDVSTSSSSED
jgi:hypothetical protein